MFCVWAGSGVADRFRELERPQAGRLKDVVLMATVTGFEGLRHPRKNDLTQFSELFAPLFSASSDEARRQAAAALSQCRHVPQSVALEIGNAPISIAAIFLTRSTSIDDQTLLQIIRAQGPAHANAIARRDNLSVHLVDALVERRQTSAAPVKPVEAASPPPLSPALPWAQFVPEAHSSTAPPTAPAPEIVAASATQRAATLQREEKLRDDLKRLARAAPSVSAISIPAIEPLSPLNEALLVRFARSAEANLFAASLAAALTAPVELGERILLDISGRQMATALVGLGMGPDDNRFVLTCFYPHLAEHQAGATRADALLAGVTREEAMAQIAAWLAAERKNADAGHQPYLAPIRAADPRQPAARQESGRGTAEVQKKRGFFGRSR
ncbi:DUF2336 domain-containing protein [Rhizobium sp. Root482]|uniref:DUF2336 domain-containing protein n=1 Tax=Rhizobium sp. Root482 TaxID=1736543 RepID=UPI0007014953|nr:DUF2336 domain-containing protein [Rhizobium sp. Root482]KQY19770.1 hypothetical protein ASD31_05035 [Rhizobium sp. Root482]